MARPGIEPRTSDLQVGALPTALHGLALIFRYRESTVFIWLTLEILLCCDISSVYKMCMIPNIKVITENVYNSLQNFLFSFFFC